MTSFEALQAVKDNPKLVARPEGQTWNFIYLPASGNLRMGYVQNNRIAHTPSNFDPDFYLLEWETLPKSQLTKPQ